VTKTAASAPVCFESVLRTVSPGHSRGHRPLRRKGRPLRVGLSSIPPYLSNTKCTSGRKRCKSSSLFGSAAISEHESSVTPGHQSSDFRPAPLSRATIAGLQSFMNVAVRPGCWKSWRKSVTRAKCEFDPRCPLQSAFRLDPLAIHTIQNGLFTHKVTHRFQRVLVVCCCFLWL